MSVLTHMSVISERVNDHAQCERDKKQTENEKEKIGRLWKMTCARVIFEPQNFSIEYFSFLTKDFT